MAAQQKFSEFSSLPEIFAEDAAVPIQALPYRLLKAKYQTLVFQQKNLPHQQVCFQRFL
jgi:hypothetical protein